MSIRFKKTVKHVYFLDPTQDFSERCATFEFRIDPLTRQRSRVADLKFRLRHAPDIESVIQRSNTRPCPFCEEHVGTMTPKFPPDFSSCGRIAFNDALVFPNFMPYDQHNALAVFSTDHYVGLADFTAGFLVDGFLASQAYLHRVVKKHPTNRYLCINWNYMPPSGGSLIHPHLHLMADKTPSDHHGLLLRRSKRFWKKRKVNYWDELIAEEKKRNLRYVGRTGSVTWLVYFAPKGMMFDVMAVFSENQSILDLSAGRFHDFACGLLRLFSYLRNSNLHSFNLALYSGLADKDYFRTHARIIPRFTIPPVDTSDVSFTGLLHDESLATMKPEHVCREMQAYY